MDMLLNIVKSLSNKDKHSKTQSSVSIIQNIVKQYNRIMKYSTNGIDYGCCNFS